MGKEKLGKAQEKSAERRFESVEEFSDLLQEKLGEKVKCVAVYGSVSRGEHTHESDIDTFVVLDDTKLEQDVPQEAKDKIRRKVTELAKETDDRITIQYFSFLTDFWDSIRKGEPLVIEVLRNGESVYDVGVFMPAKRMLERGKIKSSREAVEKRLKVAAAGYKKAERDVKQGIPHRLEQAMANAGQAPIMMSGNTPPGKERVGDALEDLFVEQDMLEQEYADIAKEISDFADKGEKHPEEVTPEEVATMLDKTDDFIRRMHQLVGEMGGHQRARGIVEEYKNFLKANVAALKSRDVEPPEEKEDLPGVVMDTLDVEDSHRELFDRWDNVIEKVRDKELDGIDEKALNQLRADSREFVRQIGEDLKKMQEAEQPAVDVETGETPEQQGPHMQDYSKLKENAAKKQD